MHERELFAQQLLEDFRTGLDREEFVVHYQPKFDIRQEEPILNSAEALVRWNHPELGMICPAFFIPLFEQNGLIRDLDYYVWRRVAGQLRRWKDKFGETVPVSVNVSRVDMYDTDLVTVLQDLLSEFDITASDLLLEITESAYTQDSGHIIENVKELRRAGFFIEMDDFGSGYSSLNMISSLPIDVMKLDMQFIKTAFRKQNDTRMLEAVIGIADSLFVPVIAEGVETKEQVTSLKAMGCDIVQGYYFSRPLPPEDYEEFLIKKMSMKEKTEPVELSHKTLSIHKEKRTGNSLHDPLTGIYNYTAFEMFLKDADKYNIALLVAEITNMEEIVRNHGRSMGDVVRKEVAALLQRSFRSVDHICHISSNEFVIIMTRVDSSIKEQVKDKIRRINDQLQEPGQDFPSVFLCVGAAFSDRRNPKGSIFQDAESILIKQKLAGLSGCKIY